jgi:hypothetical protein
VSAGETAPARFTGEFLTAVAVEATSWRPISGHREEGGGEPPEGFKMATSFQYTGRPNFQIADVLLKDIARRIQLSPTDYRIAVDHYEAVDEWLNRENSPLAPYMGRIYAQGSMAIGATISSKLNNDEFDVDAVAELRIAADAPPGKVLDVLFDAINGEKGSRYYGKVTRRSRCVTIDYDRMHLDVTPSSCRNWPSGRASFSTPMRMTRPRSIGTFRPTRGGSPIGLRRALPRSKKSSTRCWRSGPNPCPTRTRCSTNRGRLWHCNYSSGGGTSGMIIGRAEVPHR